jgi:hypothetical protein
MDAEPLFDQDRFSGFGDNPVTLVVEGVADILL